MRVLRIVVVGMVVVVLASAGLTLFLVLGTPRAHPVPAIELVEDPVAGAARSPAPERREEGIADAVPPPPPLPADDDELGDGDDDELGDGDDDDLGDGDDDDLGDGDDDGDSRPGGDGDDADDS